jgi:hypothetical protein
VLDSLRSAVSFFAVGNEQSAGKPFSPVAEASSENLPQVGCEKMMRE